MKKPARGGLGAGLVVITGRGWSGFRPSGSASHRHIAVALSATEDGAELTERLLNFSRRQQTEPRLADLRRPLTDCHGLLRRTTREGIELRIRPGPVALRVRVEAQQFQDALLNLAINACDAMPRGGVLTIAAVRRRLPAATVLVVDGCIRPESRLPRRECSGRPRPGRSSRRPLPRAQGRRSSGGNPPLGRA